MAVALIVAGLWTWQGAMELAVDFNTPQPALAAWAARSAGVSGIALAQFVIFQFLCAGFYGRHQIDRIVKWGCGTLGIIMALVALGLGLAAGH